QLSAAREAWRKQRPVSFAVGSATRDDEGDAALDSPDAADEVFAGEADEVSLSSNVVVDTVDALAAEDGVSADSGAIDEAVPEPEQAASRDEGEPEIVLDDPAPDDDSSESGAVAEGEAMEELMEKGAAEEAAERMTAAMPTAAPA